MASPSDDVSTGQETQVSKVPAIHPGRRLDTRLSSLTRSITSGDPVPAVYRFSILTGSILSSGSKPRMRP